MKIMKSFIPGCKSSSKKVISESVSQGTLNFEFLNKRYRFVSLNNSSEDRIQMKQLEGPFKSFFAHWKIESIDALKTKVQFYAEFETGLVMSVILNDFMINNLKDLMIKNPKKTIKCIVVIHQLHLLDSNYQEDYLNHIAM